VLSILIPVHNFYIQPLVELLYIQAMDTDYNFEIIILDDCSETLTIDYTYISSKQNISYTYLKTNIGRSSIRNKLAQQANYEYLIFLDADTMPVNNDFIDKYVNAIKKNSLANGGMLYESRKQNNQDLRYIYGTKRESLSAQERNKNPHGSFISANFAIKKSVFKLVSFDETHTNYGYEDTLFALDLKNKNIDILHIDNPIYHLQYETGPEFAIKIQSSLSNLLYYYKLNRIKPEDIKILRLFKKIQNFKLGGIIGFLFKKNYNWLMNYFSKNKPKLWLFDLYRIGYLCSINNKD